MKRTNGILTLVILLTCSSSALAQAGKPLQQGTLSEALDSWITNAERDVVPVAEVMPEGKYSFAPALTSGEFKDMRTFAEQLKHLAANNYWMAALILGNKVSTEMYNETGPDSVKTKAEIMEYLNGSFAALHKAVATIDSKNVVEPVAAPAGWQKTRLSFAVDAVAHSFDHYGQLVEYLRMNNIIPPDSRPKKP
jgi:hypothetical protein